MFGGAGPGGGGDGGASAAAAMVVVVVAAAMEMAAAIAAAAKMVAAAAIVVAAMGWWLGCNAEWARSEGGGGRSEVEAMAALCARREGGERGDWRRWDGWSEMRLAHHKSFRGGTPGADLTYRPF